MRTVTLLLVAAFGLLGADAARSDVPGLRYIGFGDSFSSGEGAGSYFPGTDTPANRCHRSERSYSTRVRLPSSVFPDPIYEMAPTAGLLDWDFFACSGAATENVVFGGPGMTDDPPDDVPQLERYQSPYFMTFAAITIGGNDAGFGYVLEVCFLKSDCRDFEPVPGLDLPEWLVGRMDQLRGSLDTVYTQLRTQIGNPPGGGSFVFALSYPSLFSSIYSESGCLAALGYSSAERAFLEAAARDLNRVISESAQQVGVHFVDVQPWFTGFELCSPGGSYFNGIVVDFPYGVRPESFHPTAVGQAYYARALNNYLLARKESGWTAWPPYYLAQNPAPGDGGAAAASSAQMAASGMGGGVGDLAVEHVASTPCAAETAFSAGESVRVRGSGFAAGETVTVRIHSMGDYLATLGSASADAEGDIDAVVAIPPSVPVPGPALLDTVGASSARILFTSIGTGSSFAADQDGDGVPDLCDDCAAHANPGQSDVDGDGKGDACDPCPNDENDDADDDSQCGDTDPCPLAAANDADLDGVCEDEDNCPTVANSDQVDTNADGFGDACQPPPACSDGADNDADARIDYPSDPGCASAGDPIEKAAGLACDDGVDNDGDLLVDHPADPGCPRPTFSREDPACQDGFDNDGDGGVDFDGGYSALGSFATGVPDGTCGTPSRQAEKRTCGLGFELTPFLAALAAIRRRGTQATLTSA